MPRKKNKKVISASFRANDYDAWRGINDALDDGSGSDSDRLSKKFSRALSTQSRSKALTTRNGVVTFQHGKWDVGVRRKFKKTGRKSTQKITVNLCMLYDASGSMSGYTEGYGDALEDVKTMVNDNDHIYKCTVQGASFDSEYNGTIHRLININNLEIDRFTRNMVKRTGDMTRLYDSIYKSSFQFTINDYKGKNVKTLVLVFTDGHDNMSKRNPGQIRKHIRKGQFKNTVFRGVACGSADSGTLEQIFGSGNVIACRQTANAIREAISSTVNEVVEEWIELIAVRNYSDSD